MRDENTAALGQRVGVGIWLALGATLAFLAVQTVLVTGEATIVTDLGAPSEAGLDSGEADTTPVLPIASLAAECGTGSECADGATTNGTTDGAGEDTGATETSTGEDATEETVEPAVTPATIPADGSALICPDAGTNGGPGEVSFSQVNPCSAEIEALKATCTFIRADLGYGPTTIEISTDSFGVGSTVTISEPTQTIINNEGAVFEMYDCSGTDVTFKRDLTTD